MKKYYLSMKDENVLVLKFRPIGEKTFFDILKSLQKSVDNRISIDIRNLDCKKFKVKVYEFKYSKPKKGVSE